MNRRFLILPLVAALGVLGAWWFSPVNVHKRVEAHRQEFVKSWFSQPSMIAWAKTFRLKTKRAAQIFAYAQCIEAFRIADSKPGDEPGKGIGVVEGFPYAYKKMMGASFAQRVSKLAMLPTSYTNLHKACGFNPLVAFRARRGKETAMVVLCFGCQQVVLVENDPRLPTSNAGYYMSRIRFDECFDEFRPEFVALAKEAFPADQKIQNLKP